MTFGGHNKQELENNVNQQLLMTDTSNHAQTYTNAKIDTNRQTRAQTFTHTSNM